MILVTGLSLSLRVYSLSDDRPVPDHPQLAQFTDCYHFIRLDDFRPNTQAEEALHLIASSAAHGLEPEDYHLSLLQQLSSPANKAQAGYFDLLLTDALLDLIHDLAIGRLDPAQADPQWHIKRDSINAAAILQHALLSADFQYALEQLLPQSSQYAEITETLSRYRQLVARDGWPPLPAIPLLKPGASHPDVPLLRARLAIEIDALIQADVQHQTRYDERLVQAVKDFQYQRGLAVDGIVGRQTLAELNISAQDIVKKIRINLERFRWLPDDFGERYLLINLGNYQLTAVEHGTVKLKMKVIVGSKARSTPSFSSQMTHLVINPFWNVPYKLAREDLLPRQQANPDYFFLHGFKVFLRETDMSLDPYLINWDDISPHHFPFRLQQRPGPDNALGQLKFMFPNPWQIYLHDTPNKSLFDKSQRNLSAGCIRVEQPLALATFALNSNQAPDSLIRQIESGQNLGEPLTTPLPLYVVYFTVWSYEGKVRFSRDVYQRDQEMAKYL